MTSVVLTGPDEVVTQYHHLIWRQARRCLTKLPKHTTLRPEDLYQEGVARALKAYLVYQRTNATVTTASQPYTAGVAQGAVGPNGKRKASFTSYVQVALMHRYAKIVDHEWRHWGKLINPHVGIEEEAPRATARRSVQRRGLL